MKSAPRRGEKSLGSFLPWDCNALLSSRSHLADGAVRLEEVRFEEGVKQVPGDALDGVVKGQDVDPLAVLHIRALVHRDNVAKADAEVLADHFVHADLGLVDGVIREHNANSVLALLTLRGDGNAWRVMTPCQITRREARILPTLRRTVSPLKSWRVSIVLG